LQLRAQQSKTTRTKRICAKFLISSFSEANPVACVLPVGKAEAASDVTVDIASAIDNADAVWPQWHCTIAILEEFPVMRHLERSGALRSVVQRVVVRRALAPSG
jgi:hypothetical protein